MQFSLYITGKSKIFEQYTSLTLHRVNDFRWCLVRIKFSLFSAEDDYIVTEACVGSFEMVMRLITNSSGFNFATTIPLISFEYLKYLAALRHVARYILSLL